MAIKNYTTNVKPIKTVGEIQVLLAKAGAQSVSVDYDNGEPVAVRFSLAVGGLDNWFRLPSNPEGVLETMKRDGVQGSYCNITQARAVSWRIIKDWIDSQLALIDAQQAKPAEVFFPYLLDKSGETFFRIFEDQQRQLLTSGED